MTRTKGGLCWEPQLRINELVRMVDFEIELAFKEKTLSEAGHVCTSG